MQETWVWSLAWEDPLEKGIAYPLQYSGLEKSMERRPVGYSPWGHIESDTTEFDLSQTSLQEEDNKERDVF